MYQVISWLQGCRFESWTKDLCGYIASALVLTTFSMQSMRKLRLAAIASNVAFIIYSLSAKLHPILVLHCTLLPLNIFRLVQQIEATSEAGTRTRDALVMRLRAKRGFVKTDMAAKAEGSSGISGSDAFQSPNPTSGL